MACQRIECTFCHLSSSRASLSSRERRFCCQSREFLSWFCFFVFCGEVFCGWVLVFGVASDRAGTTHAIILCRYKFSAVVVFPKKIWGCTLNSSERPPIKPHPTKNFWRIQDVRDLCPPLGFLNRSVSERISTRLDLLEQEQAFEEACCNLGWTQKAVIREFDLQINVIWDLTGGSETEVDGALK